MQYLPADDAMQSKTFAAVVAVIVMMSTMTSSQIEHLLAADECEFPAFLQTSASSRDWRRVVVAQNTETTGSIIVDRKWLRSTHRTTMTSAAAVAVDSAHADATHRYQYTETCMKTIVVDSVTLYLVSHEIGDDELAKSNGGGGGFEADYMTFDSGVRLFTCVQFVRRGPDVVQTRSAPLRDRPDDAMCDFGVLGDPDPSLIVDVAALSRRPSPLPPSTVVHGLRQPTSCSLRGGFRLRITSSGTRQSSCDESSVTDVRLESNCNDDDDDGGDSIYFHFGRSECIPEGLYMYVDQRTLCIATWTAGHHTFSVLRHNRLSYAWLLRHPTDYDASFVAHLFVDLIADTSASIPAPSLQSSSRHFRLELVRDRPLPIAALCFDETDTCAANDDDDTVPDAVDDHRRHRASTCRSSDGVRPLMCARTCGVCNATRPVACQFPPDVVGVWFDGAGANEVGTGSSRNGNNMVTILADRKSFVVRSKSTGMDERYYCIRYQSPPTASASDGRRNRTGSEMFVNEEFLVATGPTNGCRRRYACARFTVRSTSLLYFRLSETRTWPLTSSVDDPIDCRWFTYDDASAVDHRSSNRFRLMFSHERLRDLDTAPAVSCRLPSDDVSNYSIALVQNASSTPALSDCVGNVQQRGIVVTDARMLLSVTGCATMLRGESVVVSFICLDSVRLSSGDVVVVSTVASIRASGVSTPFSPPSSSSTSQLLSSSVLGRSSNISLLHSLSSSSSPNRSPSFASSFVPTKSVATLSSSPTSSTTTSLLKSMMPSKVRTTTTATVSMHPFSSVTSYSTRRSPTPLSTTSLLLFNLSSLPFRRGTIHCWLFPRLSYTSQFYAVPGGRCSELFLARGQQNRQQTQSADGTTTTADDADYFRRQMSLMSTETSVAVFSKTRGRSPRLEPQPGGANVGSLPSTTASTIVHTIMTPPSPSRAVTSTPIPVSRAVGAPDSELRSIDIEKRRDDDTSQIGAEEEEETVWDDDNEVGKTRGQLPISTSADVTTTPETDRRSPVVIAIGAAFVFALLQIVCLCYQS